MSYIPPWKLETRLQRWSACGAYIVVAVSLATIFFEPPSWLLGAVFLLWMPLMLGGMVQMHFILRREKRWTEKVWAELARTGTLDGLSPEDQEELRVRRAKQWRKEIH